MVSRTTNSNWSVSNFSNFNCDYDFVRIDDPVITERIEKVASQFEINHEHLKDALSKLINTLINSEARDMTEIPLVSIGPGGINGNY